MIIYGKCKRNLNMSTGFGTEGDPECSLLQFWVYIEVKKLNNIAKARELWGQIISHGHSKSAQWWLAFIQFERYMLNSFIY